MSIHSERNGEESHANDKLLIHHYILCLIKLYNTPRADMEMFALFLVLFVVAKPFLHKLYGKGTSVGH